MRRIIIAISVMMLPIGAQSAEPLRGSESLPIAKPAAPESTAPPIPHPNSAHPDGPLVTPGETPGAMPDATARAAGAATVDTSTSAPGGHAESPANGSLPTTHGGPLKTPDQRMPANPDSGRQP